MNSNNVEDDVPRQRKYRYASIALDGSGKHTLLMRTTQHGTDQEGKNVSVVVKNEYLPEAGAQVEMGGRGCIGIFLFNMSS